MKARTFALCLTACLAALQSKAADTAPPEIRAFIAAARKATPARAESLKKQLTYFAPNADVDEAVAMRQELVDIAAGKLFVSSLPKPLRKGAIGRLEPNRQVPVAERDGGDVLSDVRERYLFYENQQASDKGTLRVRLTGLVLDKGATNLVLPAVVHVVAVDKDEITLAPFDLFQAQKYLPKGKWFVRPD